MLPSGDCWSDDIPLCCDQLYELADEIRDVAYMAVQKCIDDTGLDCLIPLRSYVSPNEPADPMSNYVVSWLANMLPVGVFDPADRFNFSGGRSTVTVNVRLLESGYPTPFVRGEGDEEQIVVPDERQIRVAAEHSYSHGEAMFRALANWVIRNKCNNASLIQFQPAPRSGGSVGWQAQLTSEQAFDR